MSVDDVRIWLLGLKRFKDILQGSVATYLRRGGVVNNQINPYLADVSLKWHSVILGFYVGLLLSLWVEKNLNRWTFGKVTRKNLIVLSTFFVFLQCVGQACTVYETITLLLVTLPNIRRFKKKFTRTLNNKSFLIWLLTTPPRLK